MKAFVVIIVILIVLVFAVCGVIFNQLVWCKTLPLPKFIEKRIVGNGEPGKFDKDLEKAVKAFEALPLEKVEITAKDGARLRGNVLVPKKSNGRLIIACHGARSSGIGEFSFMSEYLYKNGYTLVMPDHRGCGNSDGKYMGYGTHESRDTMLWLEYARKRFPALSVFLLGVSMGGATVLMMSDKINNSAVKGIVADCPYTSAWEEFSYQLKASFHLPDFPILHICNLYCRIFSGYSFKDASPLNAVKGSKKPVLFIHGSDDDFVPVFMQKILYDACPAPKELLTVKGAVHARSYYTNPQEYEAALESFFDKYDKQTTML